MSIAVTIAILLAAASFGWAYGLRLRKYGLTVETAMNGARGWLVFCLMIACFAGLLLLSKKTDIMSPETSTYLNLAVWAITKGVLAFLGAMAVPLSIDRGAIQRSSIVLAVLLGIALVHRIESYVFSPVFPMIDQDRRTVDGYVLQTQDASCTAASLANLVSYYGLRTTEFACAKAMRTTRFGSTTGDLVRGIRGFGFQPLEVKADSEHLSALKRPAILSIWKHNARHSVVWTGQRADGTQLIIDPLVGRQEVPGSELWKSLVTSRAIVLSVPPSTRGSKHVQ